MNNRIIKLVLTVAVVAAGVSFLVISSMGSTQYYKMVDELMAEPDRYAGKTMRVHGYVEPGSIIEKIQDQKTVRTFVLENNGQSIKVHHDGPVPDTFKDKSEVVAKGTFKQSADGYHFEAIEIMAKCPSKYEGLPEDEKLKKGKSRF